MDVVALGQEVEFGQGHSTARGAVDSGPTDSGPAGFGQKSVDSGPWLLLRYLCVFMHFFQVYDTDN